MDNIIRYIIEIPVFGNYTIFLMFIVTFLIWKIFFVNVNNVLPKNFDVSDITKVPSNKVKEPKIIKKKKCGGKKSCCSKNIKLNEQILHIYVSSGGLAIKFANSLRTSVEVEGFKCHLYNLTTQFKVEEVLPLQKNGATVFFVEGDNNGSLSETCIWFHDWLEGSKLRFGKELLAGFAFAIFTIDNSTCDVAQTWDTILWKLGGRRLKKVNRPVTPSVNIEADFVAWKDELVLVLNGAPKTSCGESKRKKEGGGCSSEENSSCDSSSDGEDGVASIVDVEDLLLPLKK